MAQRLPSTATLYVQIYFIYHISSPVSSHLWAAAILRIAFILPSLYLGPNFEDTQIFEISDCLYLRQPKKISINRLVRCIQKRHIVTIVRYGMRILCEGFFGMQGKIRLIGHGSCLSERISHLRCIFSHRLAYSDQPYTKFIL